MKKTAWVAAPRSVPRYVIPESWCGIEYDEVKQSLASGEFDRIVAHYLSQMESNQAKADR